MGQNNSDDGLIFVMEDEDIALLVHESLFNNLFSQIGRIEKKEKKYTIRISNLNFQFLDDMGQLSADIKVTGKRDIVTLVKKTVQIDMKLNYDIKKNAIIVDIGEVKMNFGKLIGDVNLSKLLEIEDYEFQMPDVVTAPLVINDAVIQPIITDATVGFVPNAIKVTYSIQYK